MTSEQFLRAYDELADAIFRHCYYRVYNRETARDLMQETFTRTWEYIANGGKVENPRAFLYRTAHNLIVDASRRKRELSLEALEEEGFNPGYDTRESTENSFAAKEVQQALEQLESKYRVAVSMRYIDGLSPKEIASALGQSENVVSVHIHRGVKQLKQLLNHED